MGHYRALLVANSKFYADPEGLPELKAPIYDMARLQDALIHPEFGLFDRARVQLLPNARCSDVLLTMEDFFQSSEPEDTMLLYYSGHGKLDINNNFFLCASDTRMDRLMSTAMRDEQVNAMMRASAARTFVLILDCCSSGAWKSPAQLLPDALRGSGRFLLTSSRAGQNSGDAGVETESSAFTKLLVEAMEEADLDTDQDGYVDIDEIYKHVERNLRVTGQQAQRDFGKSVRSVALARRARSPTATEPIAIQPVGPGEPPSMTVTPERIQITARTDELPLVERIYVFNRGGGSITWSADTDDAWVSLEPHEEFVKVSLSPPAPGLHRGSVYVREQRGAVKRVRVTVQLEEEEAAAPADRGPDRIDRDRETVRASRRRRRALVGSIVALIVVVSAIALSGDRNRTQGSSTETPETGDAPAKMYLTWAPAYVGEAPSHINAISHDELKDRETHRYIAAGSHGPDPTIWRFDGATWLSTDLGGGEASINGVFWFDTSFVGVGWTRSAGDQDAAIWRIPVDGGGQTPEPEILRAAPDDQVLNKVGKQPERGLVAVGRDGSHGALWRSVDGQTWDPTATPLPGAAELLRARNVALAPGAEPVLVAVGYVENDGDKDAALWKEGEPDTWTLLRRFKLPGDQEIIDLVSGTAGELVAVGYTTDEGTDQRDGIVWRSLDGGATWNEPSPEAFGGPGDQVITRVIVVDDDDFPFRYVAGGYDMSDGDMDAVLWYSTDGIEWVKQETKGTPLAGDGDQMISSLAFDPSWGPGGVPTVLAVGSTAGRAAIWEGVENQLEG